MCYVPHQHTAACWVGEGKSGKPRPSHPAGLNAESPHLAPPSAEPLLPPTPPPPPPHPAQVPLPPGSLLFLVPPPGFLIPVLRRAPVLWCTLQAWEIRDLFPKSPSKSQLCWGSPDSQAGSREQILARHQGTLSPVLQGLRKPWAGQSETSLKTARWPAFAANPLNSRHNPFIHKNKGRGRRSAVPQDVCLGETVSMKIQTETRFTGRFWL